MTDVKANRKRDMLSSYYKTAAEPILENVLDSEMFNAEEDLSLSYNLSLADLVSKENMLIGEIKTCDVDMKQLIYTNYSKFVFAARTLSEINKSCDVMITNLTNLNKKITKLNTAPVQIDPALSELDSRNEVIKKLDVIYNLPIKLKSLIQTNNLTAAFVLYKSVNIGFPKIEEECLELMEGAARKSQRKLLEQKVWQVNNHRGLKQWKWLQVLP